VAGFEIDLPANPPPTILVVDDNFDMLELYTRHLVAHKYRVITAPSADQALGLAIRWQPDVIIIDLMMPGQDGWDLLQSLLSQAGTQTIPIVVCSVLKQKELALSLGASGFLEKPVTEHTLVSTVQALAAEK
jgi:CheY-like chemotaxis protein